MVGTAAKPSTVKPSLGVPPVTVQATAELLADDFDELDEAGTLEEDDEDEDEGFDELEDDGATLLEDLDEELDDVPPGTEHSLTPPATLPPNVASAQRKLPVSVL